MRKGDVVRARVLTVALLELANILIAIPFAVISAKINPAGGNNAGIEPNVAFFGLVVSDVRRLQSHFLPSVL